MEKLPFVMLVAIMVFVANVFAQDVAKPAGQEQTKTTEMREEPKIEVKKEVKIPRKQDKKEKKGWKKVATAPGQK